MADELGVIAKEPTSIQLTDFSTKFGLVTICDASGTALRQYKISAEEAEDIRNFRQRVPSGCTVKEWESSRAYMVTWCIEPGQAIERHDGTLLVNYGEVVDGKKVLYSLALLQPTEFEKSGDVLFVDATLRNQIDVAVAKDI